MKTGLKLLAQSPEDVPVISAVVQDSIVRISDIVYDAKSKSMTLRLNRFQHETDKYQRVMAGLRIDDVISVQSRVIDRDNASAFVVLLGISFEAQGEAPAGILTLSFAGGGDIRLNVECIEMILADVTPPRKVRRRPTHAAE